MPAAWYVFNPSGTGPPPRRPRGVSGAEPVATTLLGAKRILVRYPDTVGSRTPCLQGLVLEPPQQAAAATRNGQTGLNDSNLNRQTHAQGSKRFPFTCIPNRVAVLAWMARSSEV